MRPCPALVSAEGLGILQQQERAGSAAGLLVSLIKDFLVWLPHFEVAENHHRGFFQQLQQEFPVGREQGGS